MPAGRSTAGTCRIFMTLSCIVISWTSTEGVRGELAPTSLASLAEVSWTNRPVAFCCGTVARIHGSVTVTCACAAAAPRHANAMKRVRFMRSPWLKR
ncbi:hypothetical protein D9M72_563200 [compost metagenome]